MKRKNPQLSARLRDKPLSLWRQIMKHVKPLNSRHYTIADKLSNVE